MSNLSSYFVKNNNDLLAYYKNIILGKNYRFSILSPRLIRIEYNKEHKFEDRATSLVVKRNLGEVKFSCQQDEISLVIATEYFTLTYVKDAEITEKNLKVKLNGTDREWYPGHKEIRNVGTINYSLDDNDKNIVLSRGLYSLDGFCLINDANNYVIDNNSFIKRDKTIDLYLFMYRTDLGLCLQDYFNLTGYPAMIPRYSLGCWWYKNDKYNMYDIDNIIKKFNDEHIPISVFLLGENWHDNKNNYAFDKTLFDTSILNNYFMSKQQVFGVTINPSLSVNKQDPLYGQVSNFIPFDNKVIDVYINGVINSIMSTGIKIFNIDYCNKNDKDSLFLLNHYHYVLSNNVTRGLILSRNAMVAPHRYPIIYTGKTKVSWDTLRNLAIYNNSASNIGVSWVAHAIGGYYGGIEDDELYIRYIQFGVFNPIFILASDSGKYYKREPWKWNQIILSVIVYYMQLRNKLIPYIYNEAYIYHKFGVPFIQPLYYKYPKIYDEPNYVNQYFFGSRIMISPIVKKKNEEMNRVIQRIFIPNGIWYDYKSGKKFIGNKYYVCFYRDEDYPIFVKEGSIIPMSLDNNTGIPMNMEIQIFPAENGLYGSYELYEDDGISVNTNKNYLITKMNLDKVENGYKFTINKKEGFLTVPNRNYILKFRNMKSPQRVVVNMHNSQVDYPFSVEKNDLIIVLKDVSVYEPLEVNIIGNNIEIETINVINEEIMSILDDLEIDTILKYKIDDIIFSDLSVNKKRIELKRLRKNGLDNKFINMFIGLLEFINV